MKILFGYKRGHKPDYAEIDRLERVCFPELFPPVTEPPVAPQRKRVYPQSYSLDLVLDPGAIWQVNDHDAVRHWSASSMSVSAASYSGPAFHSPAARLRPVRSSVVLPWGRARLRAERTVHPDPGTEPA